MVHHAQLAWCTQSTRQSRAESFQLCNLVLIFAVKAGWLPNFYSLSYCERSLHSKHWYSNNHLIAVLLFQQFKGLEKSKAYLDDCTTVGTWWVQYRRSLQLQEAKNLFPSCSKPSPYIHATCTTWHCAGNQRQGVVNMYRTKYLIVIPTSTWWHALTGAKNTQHVLWPQTQSTTATHRVAAFTCMEAHHMSSAPISWDRRHKIHDVGHALLVFRKVFQVCSNAWLMCHQ